MIHGQDWCAVCGEALEFTWSNGGVETIQDAYLYPLYVGDSDSFQWRMICEKFFHRMDNNYCVNTQLSEYGTKGFAGEQWCVVSKDCQELNGGKPIANKKTFYYGPVDRKRDPVGFLGLLQHFGWYRRFWNWLIPKREILRDVSWKLCTKGKDSFLRDLEPMQLLERAESMGSVVGFVTKMAWLRLMPSGRDWITLSSYGKPDGKEWAHVDSS